MLAPFTGPQSPYRRALLLATCTIGLSGPAVAQSNYEYVTLYDCTVEPPMIVLALDGDGVWQRTPVWATPHYYLTEVVSRGSGSVRYEVRSRFDVPIACQTDGRGSGVFECQDIWLDLNTLRFTRARNQSSLDALPGTTTLEMGFCEPIRQDDASIEAPALE